MVKKWGALRWVPTALSASVRVSSGLDVGRQPGLLTLTWRRVLTSVSRWDWVYPSLAPIFSPPNSLVLPHRVYDGLNVRISTSGLRCAGLHCFWVDPHTFWAALRLCRGFEGVVERQGGPYAQLAWVLLYLTRMLLGVLV